MDQKMRLQVTADDGVGALVTRMLVADAHITPRLSGGYEVDVRVGDHTVARHVNTIKIGAASIVASLKASGARRFRNARVSDEAGYSATFRVRTDVVASLAAELERLAAKGRPDSAA